MEPLLAKDRTRLYDVIAIQEPWRNPNQNRTYYPTASSFIPAYDDYERRSCFLIYKDLAVKDKYSLTWLTNPVNCRVF